METQSEATPGRAPNPWPELPVGGGAQPASANHVCFGEPILPGQYVRDEARQWQLAPASPQPAARSRALGAGAVGRSKSWPRHGCNAQAGAFPACRATESLDEDEASFVWNGRC